MLHEFLCAENALYRRWHQHPRHSFHHLLVFVAVAVSMTMSLLSSIVTTDFTDLGLVAAPAGSFAQQGVSSSQLQGITNQLFQAVDLYIQQDERGKGAALAQIEDLLNKRVDALTKLMEEDPQAALLEVLPEDVLASMPPEIAEKLERYVTVSGAVEIFHEDLFEQGIQKVAYRVKDKDSKETFVLRTPGNVINARPGDTFEATGVSLEGSLLFAGGTGSVTSGAPSGFGISDSYSTGNQKILAMLITFTDNASQPYTADQAKAILFTNPDSVAAHYTENSFGKVTLTGDVVPQYIAVPYSSAQVCDATNYTYFDAAIAAAVSGAQAQGFTPSNYQIHMVLNPPVSCRGGAAYYPGYGPARSMNNMYGQPSFQEVVEHELGHSLGENHSATYACGSQTIANSGCAQNEYGDYLDPLGTYNGQQNHYNVAHKHGMGWFEAGNVQNVTGSGTFTLAPLETQTTATQALRIAKEDTGQAYYVGYRQPVGLDAGLGANVMRGAGVWLTNDTSAAVDHTRLLDMTPGDGNLVDSAMLSDGQTFTDSANGLSIRQLSHDANGVTLEISKTAAPCVAGQTVATLSPNTQTASTNGATLTYTLTVTNKDSSTCSPTTYTLTGGVSSGFTGVFGNSTLTANPGASVSTTFKTSAPTGAANGAYTVTAIATGQDALHTAQSSATHVVYLDTQAPTVTIGSPSNGSALKGSTVTITANATDGVGVTKVEFYVDNVLMGTDTSSPYSYKWNIRKASKGAHVITVKAYDAALNIGTATVNVTI